MTTHPGPVPAAEIATWILGRIEVYGTVDQPVTDQSPLADVGLDSVYAMTLCGDLEDQYDLEVDIEILTDNATIGDLAAAVSAMTAP